MTTFRSLRHFRSSDGGWNLVLLSPVLLTLVIAALAFTTPRSFAVSRLLPAAPALAASMWPVGATLALGGVSMMLVIGVEVVFGMPGLLFTAVAIAAVTAAAGYAAHVRLERERTLTEVRSVADTAQAVVLRPVPRHIGDIAIETLYVAAAAQARIGGDFYAAADTPHGVRLLIGDVRGKGLAAAGLAGVVANCFGEAAHDEPDLVAVARRLDTSLVRYSASLPAEDAAERFATALLAQIPHKGGHAVLLNCGHPPPLLMHRGAVRLLEPAVPSPPLNLAALVGSDYSVDTVPLAPGDQLLLYTDGVTETRDGSGGFFPLPGWVRRQDGVPPRELLDLLRGELLRFSSGALDDDIAAMLVRSGAGSAPGAGPGEAM